jgi:hypothetical protein
VGFILAGGESAGASARQQSAKSLLFLSGRVEKANFELAFQKKREFRTFS